MTDSDSKDMFMFMFGHELNLFEKKSTQCTLLVSHDPLQYLEKVCEKYSKNPDYVFKSCIFNNNLYLVVLKKLPETKTNETRKSVKNPMFAKFRADVLDVVDIINIVDPQQIDVNTIVNKYVDYEITYSVGQTVRENKYDTNINKVCSSGIHYFRSIEPAFMLRIDQFVKRWNNLHIKSWYDNGNLRCDRTYVKGKLSGLSKSWYNNGQIHLEGNYENDEWVGLWTEWNVNGTVNTKTNYVNGKQSGQFQAWHENGVLWKEGNYDVKGYKSGVWKLWDSDGVLESETTYANGKVSYKVFK